MSIPVASFPVCERGEARWGDLSLHLAPSGFSAPLSCAPAQPCCVSKGLVRVCEQGHPTQLPSQRKRCRDEAVSRPDSWLLGARTTGGYRCPGVGVLVAPLPRTCSSSSSARSPGVMGGGHLLHGSAPAQASALRTLSARAGLALEAPEARGCSVGCGNTEVQGGHRAGQCMEAVCVAGEATTLGQMDPRMERDGPWGGSATNPGAGAGWTAGRGGERRTRPLGGARGAAGGGQSAAPLGAASGPWPGLAVRRVPHELGGRGGTRAAENAEPATGRGDRDGAGAAAGGLRGALVGR